MDKPVSQATYRAVGVRHGKERITLADGLTLERAEYVQRVLFDPVAFREIVVEVEGNPPEVPALWRP
jgi:hypothetical protein